MLHDTIAAIATPPGRGGVGIVRISGPAVAAIAEAVIGGLPPPRQAALRRFRDVAGAVIDHGIALYFPKPHSFTGEEVLELQGHGGVVVLDLLLQRVVACGARIAHPGEFSQRAFLNGRIDLTQAEAVADLIAAGSAAAARLAVRSLEGAFSERIHSLVETLIGLRMEVEAAIDFPEEELELLAEERLVAGLQRLLQQLAATLASARSGRLLRDGILLVIAGAPNVGKSSLLNALAGYASAIVSATPGTTRDLLRERIQIDGIPVHLVDTAGLRLSEDPIEQEGMRRARSELARADLLLWLVEDGDDAQPAWSTLPPELPATLPHIVVRNKIDLSGAPPSVEQQPGGDVVVRISAREGSGIDLLRGQIRQLAVGEGSGEGEFLARRRHLDALTRGECHLRQGLEQLQQRRAGELLAEELRLAQAALGEITGEFSADDLLGEIFAGFCIGK